ncbi:MAG: glucose-6-phosphate dehydrogenase [Candidatus Wildermuthbacteria bacterium RIFCSPHIGHO2_01_FULL_48_25]|uniref:Glucose-6-phosphate 1-dehydrogenase n=1 Tax=Candidatus Wildermuthbacteria bacterium RIFCSPLOWO2_01_FULL_48_16 TaxID=1802461 RepID=A0A1G2RIZ6_9BACT|nr:MAG: glucose-6-phosphate dehydrogenase [Candidatus Wildermuthbacteria bacterium RIFCSPHIGHO2_01_FULL_48_25]OHA72816.1 MAG: glucose-6-phosphate dehydrogenase [Candidatus Wildermuthbacteria bacterium RIFCSPLOWO2_01_FULL_48_16]
MKNLLPTVFVIFGATGDLMQRKLAPALFHLYKEKQLPELFQVVGFSRQELSNEEFQAWIAKTVGGNGEFSKFFVYQQGLFEEKQGYEKLSTFLGMKDGEWQVCSNKLFYIAASPQYYKILFEKLAESGLTKPCSPKEGWTRVIVEKPFGKDLETAEELDRMLGKLFKEEQIYRIDHYLGKDTVQNILAFRFSNAFLQDSWNNKGIESITIKLLEKGSIGERGMFYDGIGALRDVGQNHLLQLLALFTMESPASFEGDAIRKARGNILRSLRILKGKDVEENTVRAQYEGYTSEKNVRPDSTTETYFKIQAFLEASQWKGVPITLESGKAMTEDRVEVHVVFKHPTPCLCPQEPGKHYKNILHYFIQPKEGITLSLWARKPGHGMEIEERALSFDYREAFQEEEFADAYERLLLNCIQGDQTQFVSTEEIMAEWKFVDPILRSWQENKVSLKMYKPGTTPA